VRIESSVGNIENIITSFTKEVRDKIIDSK